MGKLEEAIRDFSHAIRLEGSNPSSYNSRGLTLDKLEKRDEAIADFTRAIDLEPENPIFFHNRGLLLPEYP